MRIKQEDIVSLVAKDLNITKEKATFFERQLWLSIRNYLSNPSENKGDLLFNEFITFKILDHKIEEVIEKATNKTTKETFKKLKQNRNEN